MNENMKLKVDETLCKGCSLCINFCPRHALSLSTKLNKRGIYPPVLSAPERCNQCGYCELICPDFAIVVVKEAEQTIELKAR
jgi:2-oxoglutarate ferredoxin oxidoreductase subunit delta